MWWWWGEREIPIIWLINYCWTHNQFVCRWIHDHTFVTRTPINLRLIRWTWYSSFQYDMRCWGFLDIIGLDLVSYAFDKFFLITFSPLLAVTTSSHGPIAYIECRVYLNEQIILYATNCTANAAMLITGHVFVLFRWMARVVNLE